MEHSGHKSARRSRRRRYNYLYAVRGEPTWITLLHDITYYLKKSYQRGAISIFGISNIAEINTTHTPYILFYLTYSWILCKFLIYLSLQYLYDTHHKKKK